MTSFHINRLRESVKAFLKRVGLLHTVGRFRQLIMESTNQEIRHRKREHRQLFLKFKRQHGHVLRYNLNGAENKRRIALVCSVHYPEFHLELAIIKALELAGFVTVVLNGSTRWLLPKYYKLAGIKDVHSWSKFTESPNTKAAKAIIERFQSVQGLMTFEYMGARVGRFAVSSALRRCKLGSLDLQSAHDREILVDQVASGMAYANAAKKIIHKFRPDIMVCTDKGYSPKGELFDNCVLNGIDVISWDLAHKSSSLMLKRFNIKNRDQQNNTLSAESWRLIRDMKWTEVHREELAAELYREYATGDWFSVAGTQRNTEIVDPKDLRQRLGFEATKKTAFIFPHILWDATLFWGKSLFSNYEEWLVETVRAACANDKVNWVIKIHPAHIGKGIREGFQLEPAEVTALRKHIGDLPPHIIMIPADTEISTFSLFELMDYCVTVRGTVGIEAARLGIPVLTAGIGSYADRGFTVDSESAQQYLERVRRIQLIPRLSAVQRELAERFAYGFFMLRSLPLTSMTLKYHTSLQRHLAEGQINIRTKDDWYNASDLRAIARWVSDPSKEDFLIPVPSLNN